MAKRRGIISDGMMKTLTKADVAFALTRHITEPKVEKLMLELDSMVKADAAPAPSPPSATCGTAPVVTVSVQNSPDRELNPDTPDEMHTVEHFAPQHCESGQCGPGARWREVVLEASAAHTAQLEMRRRQKEVEKRENELLRKQKMVAMVAHAKSEEKRFNQSVKARRQLKEQRKEKKEEDDRLRLEKKVLGAMRDAKRIKVEKHDASDDEAPCDDSAHVEERSMVLPKWVKTLKEGAPRLAELRKEQSDCMKRLAIVQRCLDVSPSHAPKLKEEFLMLTSRMHAIDLLHEELVESMKR
jgi:hypothetical protein